MENSIVLACKSVLEAVHEIADLLQKYPLNYGHGMQTSIDEAAYLVSFVVGLPPDFGQESAAIELSQSDVDRLQVFLCQRIFSRIPLAYVLGETLLSGVKFFVDENVLIPRSPMAEMIEDRFFPWRSKKQPVRRILDLCTGNGCLGILAGMEFEHSKVDISDIDARALLVANKNIAFHGLESRINAVLSDVYEQLPLRQYDIITANPPYVPVSEQLGLPSEFSHEPAHALFTGENGLDIAKRIIFGASNYLEPKGILVLEVGQSARELQAQFPHYDFMWHELQHGGEGICVLTYDECKRIVETNSIE
ncbi:MAG: 50S ribosomal protein L3 N(5)-glutamine methyltransferase [Gammaproteobacteria bacterium]|nr:50S ribosomal protein L3 N(5)-glutamine methyltransferase [Gammaproteobacteria bacterium]